jgi:hypothetical protein
MVKKKWITELFCMLLSASSHAAYVANRDFLSVGQGARANAMGEAFVAVADDSSALYWNSAGLTQLDSDELSTGVADRYDGLAKEAQLNYARRGVKGMWGFGYMGSYVNDIEVTPSLAQSDLDAINTGTFAPLDHPVKSVQNHALLAAFARPLEPGSHHAIGATTKLIYKDMLGMVHGYGASIDIGYLYTAPSARFRYGANLQNIASITSYTGNIDNLGVRATATESYIPNIKTGIAYTPAARVLNGKLMFAFDADVLWSFALDDYRLGLEYSFGDVIALRAGKIFSRQNDSTEDYTLGLGLRLKNLLIDFSFLTSELGDTTRVTLGYRLGSYSAPETYRSPY